MEAAGGFQQAGGVLGVPVARAAERWGSGRARCLRRLAHLEPLAVGEGELDTGARLEQFAPHHHETRRLAHRQVAEAVLDAQDLGGGQRQRAQRGVFGQAVGNRRADVAQQPLWVAQPLSGEREAHALLVQNRGVLVRQRAVAQAGQRRRAERVVAAQRFGHLDAQQHGDVASLEFVGDFGGFQSAYDNHAQVELVGDAQHAADVFGVVGNRQQGRLAPQHGLQRLQRAVHRGARLARRVAQVGVPDLHLVLRVVESLAHQRDCAHQRAGVAAPALEAAASAQVQHDAHLRRNHQLGRRARACANHCALPAYDAVRRRDVRGDEPRASPTRELRRIGLHQHRRLPFGANLRVRVRVPALVAGVGGVVRLGGHAQTRKGIDEPRIHRVPARVDDLRVGGDGRLAAAHRYNHAASHHQHAVFNRRRDIRHNRCAAQRVHLR